MVGTGTPLASSAASGIDAYFPGVDWFVVAGLIVGLIGGSLWRAEDARSAGWKAFGESIIGSSFRFISLFIMASASYQALVAGGSLLAVPFTPGPAGAGTIGMFIGVEGPSALAWFKQNILGKFGKGPSEPSYAAPPEDPPEELNELAHRIQRPKRRPRK